MTNSLFSTLDFITSWSKIIIMPKKQGRHSARIHCKSQLPGKFSLHQYTSLLSSASRHQEPEAAHRAAHAHGNVKSTLTFFGAFLLSGLDLLPLLFKRNNLSASGSTGILRSVLKVHCKLRITQNSFAQQSDFIV